MRILVTAFEPFGSSRRNSSLEVLSSLPDLTAAGHTIIKRQIPVVYDLCGDVLEDAVREISPDAVICLGQAEGRGTVTPEYIAVNVKHSTAPDNGGNVYLCKPIEPDAPDGIITALPVQTMVEKMKEASIPSSISFTAGTYVCNNLMYRALRLCKPMGIPAGFIHLPLSYEIAAEEGKAGRILTLPGEVLTHAVLCCLDCLA